MSGTIARHSSRRWQAIWHASCGLAIVLVLPAIMRANELLIENRSPQPFVYQIRGENGDWGETFSLAKDSRHRYSTSVPLVIRFRYGDDWMTYQLPPDRVFRFASDAKRGSHLSDAGPLPDASVPRPSPNHDPRSDGREQDSKSAGPDLRLREIKVLCLADEGYRRRFSEWRDRIEKIVAATSHEFEAAFALRFTIIQCREWDYEAKNVNDPKQQLLQLVAIDPAPAELVIAFVGAIQATNTYESGHLYYQQAWSIPFGQHVMISDINREQLFGAEQLLVQRLCQVFGAFYVSDRRSIMNGRLENVEPGPIRFGDVTEKVIFLTRDFDLEQGPKSLTPYAIGKIRELYRKYRRAESKPGDDPVTYGFRARKLYKPHTQQAKEPRTARIRPTLRCLLGARSGNPSTVASPPAAFSPTQDAEWMSPSRNQPSGARRVARTCPSGRSTPIRAFSFLRGCGGFLTWC